MIWISLCDLIFTLYKTQVDTFFILLKEGRKVKRNHQESMRKMLQVNRIISFFFTKRSSFETISPLKKNQVARVFLTPINFSLLFNYFCCFKISVMKK